MTREKMMELWRKEFEESYYQWNLTPQVYDYLDGKTEHLVGPGTTNHKYYAYYDEWIVKELDGENAELARRMLVVISKIRSGGLISNTYRFVEDAEICLRIGYDFDSILQQGVIHLGSNLKPQIIYQAAELLVKYMPEESEAYTDQLQTSKLQFWKKQNADFGLALFMAIVWLKKDAERYKRYADALVLAASKGGEYVLGMLYYGYMFSPELKEMLLKKVLADTATIRHLYAISNESDLRPFLADLGAPMWPYYTLVASDADSRKDRAVLLRQLYSEDKAIFTDTYVHMATVPSSQDSLYSLYLLSLLCRDGEGVPYMEQAKRTVIHLMQRLLNEYTKQNNHSNPKSFTQLEIMDKSVSMQEWKQWLGALHSVSWGIARLLVGALGVLYEYSPEAKRFVNLLLSGGKGGYAAENVSYLIGYVLDARKKWLDIPMRESLQILLKEDNELGMAQVFKAYSANSGLLAEALLPDDVMAHQPVALEILFDGTLNIEETIEWMQFIYGTCGLTDYQPLVNLLSNKSKNLRKQAEALISKNEESVRPFLENRLSDLKGEALTIGKRLLKKWDNDRKFGAAGFRFDHASALEYCTDNYDKGNQKYISWIPEDLFTDVRFSDLTDKAPAIVLQYILSEYLSLEEPYKIKNCDKIAEMLHPQDFQAALENMYQYWKDNGAEAKKKMIMVPYCIYASDSQILRLKTQLKDWAEASRGALAAYVVNAIAMNGGNVALMMIDAMSVKFPNNQVKNAAKAAFSFAAKALEIPEDELSDKIVPTLDFSREGEKTLDYGSRTFTVTLQPDFSLTIFDNDKQKSIKSMPAPGANDDVVKATAAKKEFSELKKQIKATVQSQTNRLEKVLMNGRRWNVSAWNTLFVENPIMHCFAMGLIWGVYEGNTLTGTFRYMEDGTFNTMDEEEYTLPESAEITLVHPVELSEEDLAQWKQQLDDYEVVQPLPQLAASVITLEEKDCSGKKIIRYAGTITQSGKIAGLARKQNMLRGDVGDGGSYTCFHWVDKFLNVAALLNFEYMYMGQEYDENVTLGDVVFYRLDEEQATNDEPKENMICGLSQLPARFVSSVIGALDVFMNA